MEKDDEFLHTFFSNISQLCFDKAKENIEKEREIHRSSPLSPWMSFLNFLQHFSLSEKSYIDIGFLQTKNKGFLRKDNSLRAVYENMKVDLRRLEESFRLNNKRVQNYCQNIFQFLCARLSLMELYEKIYQMGLGKHLRYIELLNQAETIIQQNALCFTDISLTPVKATFNLECEILQQLFKALIELQRLQFLPSLALIQGAHARLTAWEGKMQNRESWKLGFLKNNPLPALFQWLQKLKGIILSKYSLYFHNILAQQTTPNDMRGICAKLQHDHYQKMVTFQKKHDAAYVILLSDNQVVSADYDSFPIIVSYPPKSPPQLETIMRMISDTVSELLIVDKVIYKFSTQDLCTYVITTVEPNIYLVIIFESKKSEKDSFIDNFISEMCTNLRCTKVFTSLKYTSK
ncbi:hypothetical protein WA026_009945 [Henosepilachna vigintioctopunctata]|uniref:Uncharacterized protein n=1 Tax=Henosepilachna vigintioctopunctata TaxID=420089 RepID=A0AAW1TL91_9CUCU